MRERGNSPRTVFLQTSEACLTSLYCHSKFKNSPAEVVELVDALASGASGRKLVGVRVPPSALLFYSCFARFRSQKLEVEELLLFGEACHSPSYAAAFQHLN